VAMASGAFLNCIYEGRGRKYGSAYAGRKVVVTIEEAFVRCRPGTHFGDFRWRCATSTRRLHCASLERRGSTSGRSGGCLRYSTSATSGSTRVGWSGGLTPEFAVCEADAREPRRDASCDGRGQASGIEDRAPKIGHRAPDFARTLSRYLLLVLTFAQQRSRVIRDRFAT